MATMANSNYNDADMMFIRMLMDNCKQGIEMATHEWHMGANQEMKDMAMTMYNQNKAMTEMAQQWMKTNKIPEIAPIEDMPEMDM